MKKPATIQKEIDNTRREYLNKVKKSTENHTDYIDAKERLKEAQLYFNKINEIINAKKLVEFSDMADKIKQLEEEYEKYTVYWYSEDGRYVIIKNKGGSTWVARGEQTYSPTTYTLYDIFDETYGRKKILKEWEGRWTKKKQKEADEIIEQKKTK
ncbi:MAG: hypothetical protein ACOCUI_00155 [bacterium]